MMLARVFFKLNSHSSRCRFRNQFAGQNLVVSAPRLPPPLVRAPCHSPRLMQNPYPKDPLYHSSQPINKKIFIRSQPLRIPLDPIILQHTRINTDIGRALSTRSCFRNFGFEQEVIVAMRAVLIAEEVDLAMGRGKGGDL